MSWCISAAVHKIRGTSELFIINATGLHDFLFRSYQKLVFKGFLGLLRIFQIFNKNPVFWPAAAWCLSNSPSFSIEGSDVPTCAHDMHIAQTFGTIAVRWRCALRSIFRPFSRILKPFKTLKNSKHTVLWILEF